MRTGILAFSAGIFAFHSLAELPDRLWLVSLPILLVVIIWLPYLRLPACFCAGFLWSLYWVSAPTQLPTEAESVDIQLSGWIITIPKTHYRRTQFQFQIKQAYQNDRSIPLSGQVRLSWYATPAPMVNAGEHWLFTVRLKRPRGFSNPGGFDYERWLFVNNIVATGYIRTSPTPVQLDQDNHAPVQRFRQQIGEKFQKTLPDHRQTAILTALAIGDRQHIQPWQWQIFRQTGTGHLIAISGLHIGLIAGLVYFFGRFAWSRSSRLMYFWPAQKAAALGGLLAAFAYALLAGFSLPTQRALIMLSVALIAVLTQRPLLASRTWCIALFLVLLVDAKAPLAIGFWLSFIAVAIILYTVVGHHRQPQPLRQWFALQVFILLALLPASLIFFQSTTLLAPLANLIAIPWSSVTVVPLTLLAVLAGLLSDGLQALLLTIAALAMEWLWLFLVWLAQFSWAQLSLAAPPLWTLGFAVPGVLLLLAPRGIPARWLGIVLLLPLIFPPREQLPEGAAQFTLLDVGDGLAVVVQTRDHVLVYDTGPRLSSNFDTADTVIIPYLKYADIRRIDTLIISHNDLQHSGGVRTLLSEIPAARILSIPEVPLQNAQPCQAGQQWVWNQVVFRLLHPPAETRFNNDNSSCVLHIQTAAGNILLPGDIEIAAQQSLLQHYGPSLQADILVAPHHGHRNKTTTAFRDTVKPRYVLFSVAYKNRFAYPRPATVMAYTHPDIEILNTADYGAIRFRLQQNLPVMAEKYRQQSRRYWHTP